VSATGRGRERIPFDYYPTPPWCVHRLLDAHADDLGIYDGVDVRVLEPTVGDGAIVRAVDSWRPPERSVVSVDALPEWTGVELRRGALDPATRLAHHHEGVDFRAWWPEPGLFGAEPFDVCLGNPAFSIAESIIRHALELSRFVVMLLRVGFLGASERLDFWRTVGADPALRVLPDRPSFDGDGTDSATYAWFVWGCDAIRGVEVLDETPIEIRDAQKPTREPLGLQVSLFEGGLG
jgi:hypothetical protein